jgi:hypothetical protein
MLAIIAALWLDDLEGHDVTKWDQKKGCEYGSSASPPTLLLFFFFSFFFFLFLITKENVNRFGGPRGTGALQAVTSSFFFSAANEKHRNTE